MPSYEQEWMPSADGSTLMDQYVELLVASRSSGQPAPAAPPGLQPYQVEQAQERAQMTAMPAPPAFRSNTTLAPPEAMPGAAPNTPNPLAAEMPAEPMTLLPNGSAVPSGDLSAPPGPRTPPEAPPPGTPEFRSNPGLLPVPEQAQQPPQMGQQAAIGDQQVQGIDPEPLGALTNDRPPPGTGSPEAIRAAQMSGRVNLVSHGSPGLAAERRQNLPRPAQQPQQNGQPPSVELEPWLPHGEFQATSSQMQINALRMRGQKVPADVYDAALDDKQAQMEGFSRSWRPSKAQVIAADRLAEMMTPRRAKNRPQAVEAARQQQLQRAIDMNTWKIKQDQDNADKKREEGVISQRAKDQDAMISKRQKEDDERTRERDKEQLEDAKTLIDHRKAANKGEGRVEIKPEARRAARNMFRKETDAAYEKAKKDAIDPDLKTMDESKIPEHLRTPEARKQWAEEQEEDFFLRDETDPEEKKKLGAVMQNIGTDLASADPGQLALLENMMTANPNLYGKTKKQAAAMLAKIKEARAARQQQPAQAPEPQPAAVPAPAAPADPTEARPLVGAEGGSLGSY